MQGLTAQSPVDGDNNPVASLKEGKGASESGGIAAQKVVIG
jgi:hypothetical protein